MSTLRYYHHPHPFALESGEVLSELTLAYHLFGEELLAERVAWVCHALTANSEVADWWPHTVERGRFLDPEQCCTVCVNIIGSHYGSTGPLSTNPTSGEPYYNHFPRLTMRDIARANLLLADHLQISRVHALMGSSIGGFQALEMALLRPTFAERLVLIATAATASPWAIAFNESQRMALAADATLQTTPSPEAGRAGMAAARSIALLSYRGAAAYNATQQEVEEHDSTQPPSDFRASSYQRYQGEKLCRRFNAYSYRTLSEAFDSHDIGRGRGGCEAALGSVKCPALVVGITSDLIFPLEEQIYLYQHLPQATLRLVASSFGHDGFLVEHEALNDLLKPFLTTT